MRVQNFATQEHKSRHKRKTDFMKKLKRIPVFHFLSVFSTIISCFLLIITVKYLFSLKREYQLFQSYSSYYSSYTIFVSFADRLWDIWEESYGKYMPKTERFAAITEIYDISMRYRLDPVLVLSIVFVESKGNPRAVSVAGARGLMQLMPGTFQYITKRKTGIYNPVINIRVGSSYLRDLVKSYRDLDAVLIHYNGGAKAFKYMPKETRLYLERVKLTYRVFSSGNFAMIREFVKRTAKGDWS